MHGQLIEGYRLSPQQRRLWRLQDGSAAFRSRCAMMLVGNVDQAALRCTVARVLGSHDTLRVSFFKRPGMKLPIQVPGEDNQIVWDEIDLRGVEEGEQRIRLRQACELEAGGPPQSDSALTIRASLVRLAEARRVLTLSLPSLCADGWSVNILAKTIAASGPVCTKVVEPGDDSFQYFNFSEWQDELLASDDEEARRAAAYWARGSRNGTLILPWEKRTAGIGRFAPQSAETNLGRGTVNRIREMSARFEVVEREALWACWAALISKLTGEEEIVVWEVVDGRIHKESEGAVGLYAKSVPVRTGVTNRARFIDLLLESSAASRRAYDLHEYFDNEGKDTVGQAPHQYPIGFEYWDGTWSHTDSGITYTLLEQYSCVDRFKLKLSCFDAGEFIRAEIHYDPLVYDPWAGKRVAAWLERLTEHAARDPGAIIGRIQILNDVERHHILTELNDTEWVLPKTKCIHDLFQIRAERHPDTIAVVFDDQLLTYGELNRRANQLAHYLGSMKTAPDGLVALCLDRSLELLVGMLGILKAGCGYTPIDPSHPNKRLEMILEDTGASIIVTSEPLAARLSWCNSQVVRLDTDSKPISLCDERSPASRATVENLVYAVFTSGSTGIPKGVAVEHRQLLNYVEAVIQRLYLPEGASFATVSTVAADLGNTAIFPSLVLGGCLHIISSECATDPVAFGDYFTRHRIDCLKIVPSHFAAMLDSPDSGRLMPLRRLILGGEALPSGWAEELHRLSSDCVIANHYGPTETTVGAFAHYSVDRRVPDGGATLPLGRPLANITCFILDPEMKPLPLGTAGELYIGGAGVSRGYLRKAELTAERFNPDPLRARPGGRLYRTGDVARHLASGEAEFLGRFDNQIKFHGHRVELNEIRAALNRHPMIKDSVVRAATDDKGNQVMVAYYVSRQEADVGQLREFLAPSIVEETIPSVYVRLKRMPLTANGKVDYQALPGLEEARRQIKQAHLAPRTVTEELIAGIWADVLGLERLGVEANFFELGGHSLLATRVMSRIRNALKVDVPLRALFESPTVAALAATVENLRNAEAHLEASLFLQATRPRELPLSYAQQRLWFIHQLDRRNPAYNISRAMRARGAIYVWGLRHSLREIARRHEVLRTRFETEGREPVQVIDDQPNINMPIWDLEQLTEAESERQAREIARKEGLRPFDLQQGPVWRAGLVRISARDHVLLLNMHHIASDAWSTSVMIREFTTLYGAFCQGAPSPLGELPLQYADFALRQRDWLQGERLETELNYWREQLDQATALELPTDRRRPAVTQHRGASVSLAFPLDLTQLLKDLSQREGVTLFMTLLAAFQIVLGRYAGQDDVVIGTDVANRNRVETEGLIGFFVNQLVLRTDLSGRPALREMLNRVRETTLSAYAHQDVPFERLVQELVTERDLSRAPLFQVKLISRNAPRGDLHVPGVRFSGFGVEEDITKLDLTLSIDEGDESLVVWAGYETDLFDGSTVIRLIEHVKLVLEHLVANGERCVNDLELMTDAERQQVIVEWNHTRQNFGKWTSLCELLEAQIARTPDSVAVICWEGHLSYARLDQGARQLAAALALLGAAPELPVGICTERSLGMMVALTGILKVGAPYVPLDPGYPVERLTYMVEDAKTAVLLIQRHLAERLGLRGTLVFLEDCQCAQDEVIAENLLKVPAAEGLAYSIYTSGSTGRPKGAMNTHIGIVNRLLWMQNEFRLGSSDRILQKTSISFDVSVWELFWPLIAGASVVLAEPGRQGESRYLKDLIAAERITTVHFVPSMLEHYLEAEGWSGCESVERVISSGEALSCNLAHKFKQAGGRGLRNLYGPTEAAIDVSCGSYDPDEGAVTVGIGRPIANLKLYVVDRCGKAGGIGGSGEVYIGGTGVGRGYWGQAGQTGDRYVPDWLSGRAGGRLYRTGDKVRWKAKGELEYLGRLDDQVKLRGYRIELGEIEAALREHPGVRQSAVCVREYPGRDTRLVGYVVGRERGVSGEELRRHLRGKLPEYMVPWAIVGIDEMPVTANGKLDRRRLPAVEAVEAKVEGERSPVEEIVAGIWSEVLGVGDVGRDANFFEMGGHSLLATQVISRIRQVFDVELPLRRVFEEPTLRGFGGAVGEALRKQEGLAARVPPLRRVSREQGLPLSFAQQRLWFLDQLEPESAFYNIPAGVRLKGEVGVGVLRQALQEVLRRHEVLRTSFQSVEGEPVQWVREGVQLGMPIVDLRELGDGMREGESRRLANQEAQEPFDLREAGQLRVRLVQEGEHEQAMLVTMHHIISDGWSRGVLVREVSQLYEAYRRGEESPLDELGIQYADYAVWQREWLRGEALERQMKYWREQIRGAPAVLELPSDRVRPAVASYRGGMVSFGVDEEVTGGLRDVSRRESVTLFMVLLAGLGVLLRRYSGQEDVVVGTPIAGRTRAELEGLIGFFVNTLALRLHVEGEATLREVLRKVREVALGGYEHQEVPFEKVVEELQPDRSLSYSPLFQVMLVIQNARGEHLKVGEAKVEALGGETQSTKFDLTAAVSESGKGLVGGIEYNCEMFDEVTVERMSRHVVRVLEGFTKGLESRVQELPLLSGSERKEMVVSWNQTVVELQAGVSLGELFQQQVRATPEATAIVRHGACLSYGQANEHANQLAHCLQGLGVGGDVVVGICLERGLEQMISVLGVVKAGAAYLPLDPSYPHERLAFMLADSESQVLITQGGIGEKLGRAGLSLVKVDGDWQKMQAQSFEDPSVETDGENLTYVIYTSGSTGWPKGVGMRQDAMINLLLWQQREPRFLKQGRTLQFASISFDVSFQEMFLTWINGGTVVLVSEEVRRDGEELLGHLRAEGIERIFVPFVALQQIAEAARLQSMAPTALKEVLTAGEQLQISNGVSQFFQQLPGAVLENCYGPSETHVVTAYRLRGEVATWPTLPPIGGPIANTEVYVLDSRGELQPVGVVGELHVGGKGVARGYLGRPAMTAEKFVPNSLSQRPGARLYRTGDLARYLPDGNLEFLGRVDQQVKVRGYRIELGEVEAALVGHAVVKEAVVVAGEAAGGGKRLIAYVVRGPGGTGVGELREHLKQRLPEYMVPAVFVELGEMPLTASGKVDRRRLTEVSIEAGAGEQEKDRQMTPVEELLGSIWAQVLGVAQVDAWDHFFQLGGHSLLATQVISRIRQVFDVELALRRVFEEPTLRGLGGAVEEALREQEGQTARVPPLRRVSREQGLPLSFAQQRLWFIQKLDPGSAAYNIPLAVRLIGELDEGALRQAVGEVVRRHEVLRTRYEERGGEVKQVIEEYGGIEVGMWDISGLGAEEVEEVVRETVEADARRPFDLGRGPVWRGGMVKLGEGDQVVMLSMHHVASDGWSMGVLMKELGRHYEAYRGGLEGGMGELEIQYGDYAVWQREWLGSGVLEEQLGYWRERLSGVAALELPTDWARPAIASHSGRLVPFNLSVELTERLKGLSRREGVTLFMTLLAAFDVVLSRQSAQEDVVIGSPIANRNRLETEGLIGFFVNQLVLRVDLSANPTVRELLRRVREVTLDAYAHQDVPFERLVEELAPPRDVGRPPLFQVEFALQNAPHEYPRFGDLNFAPLGSDRGISRFDLTVSFVDRGQALSGVAEYSADMYERSTIERLLGRLTLVLEAFGNAPGQPICDLPVLTEEELSNVLCEWNRTTTDYPAESCLPMLFERQVALAPDAIAVVYQNRQLSYSELNRRGNQLANHLIRLGARPEGSLGLCLHRGLETIIAMVSILKARGTYVPLDPRYPTDRMAFVLGESKISVVVTQRRLLNLFLDTGVSLVVIDETWKDIAGEDDVNPGLPGMAQSLAYVIYTSGSTGYPKGVCVSHQAVNRLVFNTNYVQMDASDVIAQVSNTSFDAATFEVWATLLHGGRLALIQQEEVLLPVELGERIDELAVTTIFLTTALLNQMAMYHPGGLEHLKTVLFGGEAADSKWVRQILAEGPPGRLLHVYGPTESTTFATWHLVQSVSNRANSIPIGKPISNTSAYVLDSILQPAPVGVMGELYIGGDGLARAYQNQPALTAEKFLPDSFLAGGTEYPEGGRRIYRTGDIARYRPDGSIDFVGRRDHQVKIRGHRIEMGEIESVLLRYTGVQRCVVDTRGDESGDRRLVAYIVAAPDTAPGVLELREFCKKKLPDYMAPAAYVFLNHLPLTPNGKVDRRVLAEYEAIGLESRVHYVPPQSSMELCVASVWRQVLNLGRVGVHDNFFDLGGHSLLLVKAHAKLQAELGRKLGLIELFEYPTIGSLAAHLSGGAEADLNDSEQASLRAEVRRERTKRRRATSNGIDVVE